MSHDKKLQGRLSINRTDGNDNRWVTIRLQDEKSRILFLDIKINMLEFAEAITGLSGQPVQYSIGDTSVLGKRRESKTIAIPIPERIYLNQDFEEWFNQATPIYEIDGWKAMPETFNNYRQNKGLYKVTFVRFLED